MNGLFKSMGVPAQSFGQTQPPERPMQQNRGLFGMDKQQLLNLMTATGASLATRNPGAFGQTLMGLQQQQKGERGKKAIGNMTAKWLRTQGRTDLADAVESGQIDGKSAMEFYKGTKAEKPAERKTLQDAITKRHRFVDDGSYVFGEPDANAPKPFDKESYKAEQDLRKEYTSQQDVADYTKVRSAYEKIRASAQTDSGPGDMGIVFNFMKMLDPGSTVREGEYATAEKAPGVSEQILNSYNKLVSGETLSPEARRQFIEAAGAIYNETSANLSDTNEYYSGISKQWNVDPNRVIRTPEKYEPLQLGKPKTINTPKGKVTIEKISD